MRRPTRTIRRLMFVCAASLLPIALPAWAADHRDGPIFSLDKSADIADVYFFLDPNDPTMAVMIGTTAGFIVPSEGVNEGIFDPLVRYRFSIENTGDARPDRSFEVGFSPRVSTAAAQIASVSIINPGRRTNVVRARATNPSLQATAPAPVVTNLGDGVSFFAGEVDDPFFFDIPGFSRFVSSVLAGSPDPTRLNRGRNSFAGYNVTAIALRVPVAMIKGPGNIVGVSYRTLRRNDGSDVGTFRRADRMGTPAVNVALVPFAQKDAYNAGTPVDDARGVFAPGIVATLTALGTNSANINTLAGIAVTNGDYLRLNTDIVNSGPGGGNNAGAGFPNGRRLQDDVIDTELFIITNGLITAGDQVDANDVPFRDSFPFIAPPQQPREGAGNVEDNTRN